MMHYCFVLFQRKVIILSELIFGDVRIYCIDLILFNK